MAPSSSPSLFLADHTASALRDVLAPLGVPEGVVRRIFCRVHDPASAHAGDLVSLLDDVPGLSRAARVAILALTGPALPRLEVIERRQASDGFVKYLFRLPDGHAVEAVRIPLPDPAAARALKDRRRAGLAAALEPLPASKYVVCVSSQAGCALACDFCATGRLGAIRSLAPWEILDQIRQIARDAEHPVRGVVFMGMGEPFLNYDNVITAASILSDPAGFAISQKAITISTAGVVPMIRRFTSEGHRYRLIVSLGAPNGQDRLRLMPIEKRWPLPSLLDAVRAHAAKTGDRMTFAYVAIGGVNMSVAHARQLVDLLAGLRAKISLIDVTDDVGGHSPPSDDELREFRDVVAAAGIPIVRRYSGGKEIGAACGTLSASQQGGDLVALRARA